MEYRQTNALSSYIPMTSMIMPVKRGHYWIIENCGGDVEGTEFIGFQ
ncbi:MAG: hypothetical protein OXH57_09860 [Ekhidna sp.]|nr:hypothetical protein [Ekhidna sp.]